ncbi:MAG: hypothetical protein PHH71_00275 [Clostridia bacterium]|jgi:hypothetical protein|nr:hypothetical protein [Clostridia bacterium]MDD3232109.1 hypothetical protein [Clostridia bacterium]MDD3862965.1 hypothetical protein [Clostridia bacterium]MDD4408957.1 hypothetical protein [Clostridia bacterium]
MGINVSEIGERRLEQVLVKDKKESPKRICDLLKSDLNFLFENYMDVSKLDMNFDVINGIYQIDIKVQARRLKGFGSLPYWGA